MAYQPSRGRWTVHLDGPLDRHGTVVSVRRTAIVLVAVMVAGGALGALALARTRARRPALQLRQTKLGRILVDSRGFTVYAFTRDRKNVDRCARIRNCLSVWPVVAPTRPLAGRGVRASLIRTITVRRGVRQLTYAGHPLYTYVGDRHPGQISYVNIRQFGGRWPALNALGHEVR